MYLVKKVALGTGLVAVLTLAGCDKTSTDDEVVVDISDRDSVIQESDDDYEAYMKEVAETYDDPVDNEVVATNPCLNPELISKIKDGIKSEAVNEVELFGADKSYIDLIYQSDITLDNISQAMYADNGNTLCSANVSVTYYGDADTKPDLVLNIAKIAGTDIPSTGNTMADGMRGFTMMRSIRDGIGVNEYVIDSFDNISSDSFSHKMDYGIQTTYSESGESQQYFEAAVAPISKMLATIFVYDMTAKSTDRASDSDMPAVDDYDDVYTDFDLQESRAYLTESYNELEALGLATDDLVNEHIAWIEKRNTECGEDIECRYTRNFEKGNVFRELAGLDVGG